MAINAVPDRGDDPKRKFKAGSKKPMTRKEYSDWTDKQEEKDWNDLIAGKNPMGGLGTPLHQARGKDRF